MDATARLLIACPDRPGIVAAVTGFLFARGANITDLDQHSTDARGGSFFMRLEFQIPEQGMPDPTLKDAFARDVAARYDMDWQISYTAQRTRMAIFVSQHDHALLEILWRWSRGELPADISAVISNHAETEAAVRGFGVAFHHIPVTAGNKIKAESRALDLIGDSADLIVLARYMQILSPAFVGRFRNRIINIHHSFLPAFAGANPYQQAYDKGVKLIGATAHYVTADLDEGPIIEQDTARVSHRHSVDDLRRLGRDLERQVLARAVLWHLEDRIIVDGSKTIVFS